jgi:hypothetical protein
LKGENQAHYADDKKREVWNNVECIRNPCTIQHQTDEPRFLQKLWTNIGPVYRWMHGMNNQHREWYQNWPMGFKVRESPLIFGEYVKVRESSHTWLIIWVITILNHIDTRQFCLGLKVLAWYTDPNGIQYKNTSGGNMLSSKWKSPRLCWNLSKSPSCKFNLRSCNPPDAHNRTNITTSITTFWISTAQTRNSYTVGTN